MRSNVSMETEQNSNIGDDERLISTKNEISVIRSGPASVSAAEVSTQEQNFHSPPGPAGNESAGPISYEPMRRIDAGTVTAPKRFYRTFWRGLTIRFLKFHRVEGNRMQLSPAYSTN